jgi:apolipoprotein N-acyltransferase
MDSTAERTSEPKARWYCSTLALAFAGSVLLWAALPPLAIGWLGWIAPVPWLLLVRADRLTGRRPYLAVWLAGFVFWMATLQWLRLPHPAVSLGWIALSAYLACYLPAFVGLSRVAVHRLGVPLWLAAPAVWTGLELARAHLLTGFLLASLAHTQTHVPVVIQISDLVGEYGVDFVMMAFAAGIASILFRPRQFWAAAPAVLLLAATLGYGVWRLNAEHQDAAAGSPSTFRIALIQGNSLADWKQDPDRRRQIMDEYVALSDRAVELTKERGDGRPIELIVWPETMFRSTLFSASPDIQTTPELKLRIDELTAVGPHDLAALVKRLGAPALVGIERVHFLEDPGQNQNTLPKYLVYNSAVLVDRDGQIVGVYDKVHRVMFGEYIPFADWFPMLYRWPPLTGGVTAGKEPVVLILNDWVLAPSICYETVLPHVIRRQANMLYGGSLSPDVLVNLTNDAWYWGSSGLDLHLACGVFRAVETRLPLVIAANGGLSAWIDVSGRVRAQSQRQQPEVLIADVERRGPASLYVQFGDWFAGMCLAWCLVLAIVGWRDCRWQAKGGQRPGGDDPSR